jgi:hypothetical protein
MYTHTYRDLHRAHPGGKHTDDSDAPPVRCHGRGRGRGKREKLLDTRPRDFVLVPAPPRLLVQPFEAAGIEPNPDRHGVFSNNRCERTRLAEIKIYILKQHIQKNNNGRERTRRAEILKSQCPSVNTIRSHYRELPLRICTLVTGKPKPFQSGTKDPQYTKKKKRKKLYREAKAIPIRHKDPQHKHEP